MLSSQNTVQKPDFISKKELNRSSTLYSDSLSSLSSYCGFISSSSSTSSSTAFDPTNTEEKPPCYNYYCCNTLIPHYEEVNEKLPDYTCTVYKRGYVYLKQEYDVPHLRTKKRYWRRVYLKLWGTLLQIYKHDRWPKRQQQQRDPMFIISLAGADAARALDYFKRPNAFKLTCANGPQLLIRASSHIDMISWIEHLQAGINISLDLELRPMPNFVTMPPLELTQNAILDQRILQLERAREHRRRTQHEILI